MALGERSSWLQMITVKVFNCLPHLKCTFFRLRINRYFVLGDMNLF